MAEQYIEVTVPVTVRVTVGEDGVEAALDTAWSVANSLDTLPVDSLEDIVRIDAPTGVGTALLFDEGGVLLAEY